MQLVYRALTRRARHVSTPAGTLVPSGPHTEGVKPPKGTISHWETERGEIVLPSSELATVCQAVQKVTHDYQAKVLDETHVLWKGLTRKEETDPTAYTAALSRYTSARQKQFDDAQDRWRYQPLPPHLEELTDDLEWRLSLPRGAKPARVLKSDLPFPTIRTTDFPAGEGSVSFDKERNTVRWSTDSPRHVIDREHSSGRSCSTGSSP